MLLIIDGHSLSIRAFFGCGMREDVGIELFDKFLKRLLIKFKPTHTAVAWDTQTGSTEKKEIFSDYKAHRGKSQFSSDYIENAMLVSQRNGFTNLIAEGEEADDIIGKLSKLDIDKVIITSDKDMLQLVSDRTTLYSPIVGVSELKKYTPESILNEFGFDAKYYVDYKALIGDNSDGYKGVRGIGPKTAQKLIKEYKTISNLYNNIDKLSPGIAKKLVDGKDDCELSYKLAKIDTSGLLPRIYRYE